MGRIMDAMSSGDELAADLEWHRLALLVDEAGALTEMLTLTPEGTPTGPAPGWETHTYQNKEAGFALSFATPAEWLSTGPIGERQIGGWYDPKYPCPPDPAAVWVYWITSSPPSPELNDPIMLAPSQKRVATNQVQGNWSYRLMCVAPLEIFDQQASVFNRIMESLRPLPLEAK